MYTWMYVRCNEKVMTWQQAEKICRYIGMDGNGTWRWDMIPFTLLPFFEGMDMKKCERDSSAKIK